MAVSSFIYRYRSNSAFQQQLSLLPLEGGGCSLLQKRLSCFSFVFNFRGWNQPQSQNSFCDIKFFHLLVQGELIKLV